MSIACPMRYCQAVALPFRPSQFLVSSRIRLVVETGLHMGLERKTPPSLHVRHSGIFSPVRFLYRIARIAAICSDSQSNAAEFLCSADCVAEREGFEPPIRFPVYTLSKRAPSATRPSLRRLSGNYCKGQPRRQNPLLSILWVRSRHRNLDESSGKLLETCGHD
jgi:hypothetical protein